jgi:hypothetical protein
MLLNMHVSAGLRSLVTNEVVVGRNAFVPFAK